MYREAVHIEVEDVNEYSPTWPQRYISADVVEGRVYDQIIHVEAIDRDGADSISRICRYHIVTPRVPFEVDADGQSRVVRGVFMGAMLPAPLASNIYTFHHCLECIMRV